LLVVNRWEVCQWWHWHCLILQVKMKFWIVGSLLTHFFQCILAFQCKKHISKFLCYSGGRLRAFLKCAYGVTLQNIIDSQICSKYCFSTVPVLVAAASWHPNIWSYRASQSHLIQSSVCLVQQSTVPACVLASRHILVRPHWHYTSPLSPFWSLNCFRWSDVSDWYKTFGEFLCVQSVVLRIAPRSSFYCNMSVILFYLWSKHYMFLLLSMCWTMTSGPYTTMSVMLAFCVFCIMFVCGVLLINC